MASLARARSRFRAISQLLDHNYSGHPYIYLEHSEVIGVHSLLRQSSTICHAHPCLYTSRRGLHMTGEQLHPESIVYSEKQLQTFRLPKASAILKAGIFARGVHKLWHRLIQTGSQSTWDHPWSRDKLAERMANLRQKRIDTKRLKERRRRLAATQYSSMPEMPLPSQPLEGVLQPRTENEERVAPLFARSDLIVTRNIEWANVLVGFEQENKYVIMDPRQSLTVVGYIAESSNFLSRQFLRSRRPFEAAIMDAAGSLLFKVRRPIWFINSTIYAEVGDEVVGFAKRRWHLWRRIYDVYLGKRQFAVVENPGLWNWTFTLKDEDGNPLAEIDRHFRGFGYEMLTDAGQYAIRFGEVASNYHPATKQHTLTAHSSELQGISVNPGVEGETFIPARPLNLMERTVTLALAISLDNDYFSRSRGFFMFPFFSEEP
ncbi:hypothetical protein GOP47_0012506 [Adiantum capillus-veneris]|uniref:Phospholipid scramblase n=1 Tax=Adiantum capillus-veneris TaxID=13818 RepID=A0A9D4ZGJ1_ADICA|nr:hypothetical protein GOP47_0012506 [Adiantum capillus-veneris]